MTNLSGMVGVRGLEPRASSSQTTRATNCATPRRYAKGHPQVVSLLGTLLYGCSDYWQSQIVLAIYYNPSISPGLYQLYSILSMF